MGKGECKGVWGEREEGLFRKYLQGEMPRRGLMEGGNNGKSEQLLHMQQRKKKEEGRREGEEKTKQWCDCALKRLCRGGVCLDVGSTSPGIYVEKGFLVRVVKEALLEMRGGRRGEWAISVHVS